MTPSELARGRAELAQARQGTNGLLVAVGAFSTLVNILVLTGPLYMLQVYDRVLGSHSEATLAALTVIMVFLFGTMGILDQVRSRILTLVGARIHENLDGRVFAAALRLQLQKPGNQLALAAQKDLEAVQRVWASPVMVALFDLPWAPFFMLILYLFNAWMGVLATAGLVVLAIVTWLNQHRTKTPISVATAQGLQAERHAEAMKTEAETLLSMGMERAAFDKWQSARDQSLRATLTASAIGGRYGGFSKTFRMILQSAILGLGAWAVLHGQISGGAMIAGSILMGRALQPIEQLISQWAVLTRAGNGRKRLVELLTLIPPVLPRTPIPRPAAFLDVQGITVVPPGEAQPVLRGVTFSLAPGQALGVIGTSGAGKSSLARAITGVWGTVGGKIRLGGATLDQYSADALGAHIGYLPQRVSLLDGTIAENIARLQPGFDPEKVIEAARRADAHELILHLPKGYDTPIAGAGHQLSGGQIQRIGLARAFFGDPVLLVLDEPNSNLDNDGSEAVNAAVRRHKEAGGAVIVIAHRPAAIHECDLLLVLDGGVPRAFGPRDQVLRNTLKNHQDVQMLPSAGGVS